jgi:hypothetical protein
MGEAEDRRQLPEFGTLLASRRERLLIAASAAAWLPLASNSVPRSGRISGSARRS